MEMVLITALGVGGATFIGSVLGFIFKKISHKFSDIVLSFAAGVMLSAAVLGLIIPSIEYGGVKYTTMESLSRYTATFTRMSHPKQSGAGYKMSSVRRPRLVVGPKVAIAVLIHTDRQPRHISRTKI